VHEVEGGGSELGHCFLSPGPKERIEVMILYYDTERHVRCGMVCWLPLVFEAVGER
jgi:hypothetical protein